MNSYRMRTTKIVLFAVCIFLIIVAICVAFLYLFYIPKKYASAIERYSSEFGVESELVFAVIRAESNFRSDAVSSVGAVGLMQIMPSTAEFIRKTAKFDADIQNPDGNIRMGTWYLSYLSGKFDTVTEILAAYNAGEGTVNNWLKTDDYCNAAGHLMIIPYRETEQYIQKVKKFYNCYKFFYI